MKIPVIVALDEETYPIWKKLPGQQKSATIRELLLDLKEKEDKPDPQESLKRSFEQFNGSNGSEKHSRKQGANLSEMARTVKSGKKSSRSTPEESIKKQLRKA